ncbi:MAG: hypothetical protein GC181_11375 [Bacteroidetes bacterium]|nr:hypothetical protein [Bacteroidota bacterium]
MRTLFIISVLISIACKSALYGPEFPVSDLTPYDYVVIASIDTAIHHSTGHRGLKTFNATIVRSLKGELTTNSKIKGKATIEQPHAVCPIGLQQHQEYLLLLSKESDSVSLSRFSFPVKKGYVYYDDYIRQLEYKLIQKKN